MIDPSSQSLADIFKAEYSNLVAVLSHYYGIKDLQVAEDIVSETFVKAMKAWSHKGVPHHPRAWLRKVAQHTYFEELRRKKVFEDKVSVHLTRSQEESTPVEITDRLIEDGQLRMMFLLCDPRLTVESQLCLSLRILCGFSTEEIAKALLSNKETVNKKLYRAKNQLKISLSLEDELKAAQYMERLDGVLRVIYLIFNEGYYSAASAKNIRHELCWEAMRLGLFLSRQQLFPVYQVQALVALMCFHASRLEARQLGETGDLLYHQQDRKQWNWSLIEKGRSYLEAASKGDSVSKYHLEAAIAFWHTQDDPRKWDQILLLYNKLLIVDYSPMIALNRTYALAKVHTPQKAIEQALKLDLKENVHYLCLVAELYRMNDEVDQEIRYLTAALKQTKKENEKNLILRKLETALNLS